MAAVEKNNHAKETNNASTNQKHPELLLTMAPASVSREQFKNHLHQSTREYVGLLPSARVKKHVERMKSVWMIHAVLKERVV